MQLGVVWEIAQIVMRPTGTWVRDAKRQFILWGAAGILLAAALPWLVTPPAANLLHRLEVRGNLFTSLVVCELIAVVTRTSKSLGLGWRNHVMALVGRRPRLLVVDLSQQIADRHRLAFAHGEFDQQAGFRARGFAPPGPA